MRTMSAILLLCCLTRASNAEAQADFGGLPLKPGDVVYVTDPAGVEVSGSIVNLSPSSLSLAGHSFKPEPGLRIERRGDPLWDGAAIGLAVGLGAGALMASGECGVNWHAWQCAVAGGAWGTLLGTLIDFKHEGRTQVFVGVAASRAGPTPGTQGVVRRPASVSVRISF